MLQTFIPFIDENRLLIINFFELLYDQNQTTYSIYKLKKELDISSYKMHHLLEEVEDISKTILQIKMTHSNDILSCTLINSTSVHQVISYEARNSINFQIFCHVFFNIKNQSNESFAQNLNISISTYFRLKKNMFNRLGKSLSKNISQSEIKLRYYIYTVFKYFSYFEFIKPYYNSKIPSLKLRNSITYASQIWNINPTKSQRVELSNFIFINYYRSKMGFIIAKKENANFYHFNTTPKIKLLTNHIVKVWQKMSTDAFVLIEIYLTFCINNSLISAEDLSTLKNYSAIEQLTKKQMLTLQKQFSMPELQERYQNIQNFLLKTNAQIYSPFFEIDIIYRKQNLNSKTIKNDKIQNVLGLLIQDIKKETYPVTLDSKATNYLENVYYLLILTELPLTPFINPIHITIDFTDNDFYNNYIAKTLKAIPNSNIFNVVIDKEINRQTKIFISDVYDLSFQGKQVIWKSAPEPLDWRNLYYLIQKLI